MVSPTLVVMAAGMGSRFGGPKQLEPVGPSGETLIDYVLFDGHRAGFQRAILVVREELVVPIETVADRHRSRVSVALARQAAGPRLPRGTVPAVLAAGDQIDGPFAALNADDFYGPVAYARAAAFLREPRPPLDTHGVVALPLAATLSSHGGVVRAVCDTQGEELAKLDEVRDIERHGDAIVAGDRRFMGHERVSMNFWAFQRSILGHLGREFDRFSLTHDSRAELPLPVAIDALIAEGRVRIRIIDAPGPWFGLTHLADRAAVRQSLRLAAEQGEYPTPLWTS